MNKQMLGSCQERHFSRTVQIMRITQGLVVEADPDDYLLNASEKDLQDGRRRIKIFSKRKLNAGEFRHFQLFLLGLQAGLDCF